MPELTPTGAVDVVQRQVRRVRRRKNLYEAQRALYLTVATGAVAALILLPLALYASTGTFAIAAWSAVLILTGIALVLGGALRRRWIAARDVLAWIEHRSTLGGRVRTLLELAARPGTRPGFFHALLVSQIGHDLDTWEPHRLVPRRVPRLALGTALIAVLVLAAALRLASLAAPAVPTVSFNDRPAGATRADATGNALMGERVVVAPGVPSDDKSARAGGGNDDSTLTSLPSALQENVRQQVWGKAWERVRDALAQVGAPSGGATNPETEYSEQDGADGSEEWEIARAPSGELTRRRRSAGEPRQETPTDATADDANGSATAPADAAGDDNAEGENGGGAGNSTSPGDLFAGTGVDTGHGDASFELSLAARMRADRGAGRRGGATAPDPDPDAKPALAADQRRESAAHRMAVPAAYETVVREVFAHRRAENEQP